MSEGQSIAQSLLGGLEFDNPRLYDLLSRMIGDLYRIDNQLNPPSSQSFGVTGQLSAVVGITGFSVALFNNNVKLTWDAIPGLVSYELRYKAGVKTDADWDTASVILKTSTTSADINPVGIPLTFGDHTFLIKSLDSNGNYSTSASYVNVNIPIIAASVITSTVVGNFVLLYWTIPASVFVIDHYNVYKNSVLQGKMNGTFEAIFETAGGTFTYVITPVDIVGNIGTPSNGLVVAVNNPADYALQATIVSTLTGIKTNCIKETVSGMNYLLACINATETYQDHFITPGWASPQAQVTAGYPIYIEPAKLTGQYVEVFDFGSIISNIIATVNWNQATLNGSVTTATTTLETSTDNITYSAAVVGTSIFAASMRYVRLTLKFVGATDLSLAYFSNIQCLLNVHREQDGGVASVFAADAAGTVITFTKTFKSIDTIDVTPVSTVLQTAVYDFAFPVNPTTFKVKLYNAAGARVDGTVTWIARGIL